MIPLPKPHPSTHSISVVAQSHTRFTYCTAPYRYPAYVTAVAAAATLYRVAQVPYSLGAEKVKIR